MKNNLEPSALKLAYASINGRIAAGQNVSAGTYADTAVSTGTS
jgi:spore coat protein U-like protein